MSDFDQKVLNKLARLERDVARLQTWERPSWTFLTDPLTSTAWDGDAHSTEAKTKIDLSAVFGVPAGVKAVLAYVKAGDSDSANTLCLIGLAPNDTAGQYVFVCKPYGNVNDVVCNESGIVPCDAGGDIYSQITATGAGTFDVTLQIWGFLL